MTDKSCRSLLLLLFMTSFPACDRWQTSRSTNSLPEDPSPPYRNIETETAYVGDETCTACHEGAASAYQDNAMARSFHRWTPEKRIEAPLSEPLYHRPTGFYYSIVEVGNEIYQEEFLIGPEGIRVHELRKRMDYVMGSGNVARTYFTEENGRLFQLPLTWYRQQGWDFSPGYETNSARFDRLMPDRCVACHGSYPQPIPFLEGKYAVLPPGIGCERCHGPGALHVSERSAGAPPDSSYDDTIVNPRQLPFERRLDVCEQCHVHTPVTVLREGQDDFSYQPSQPLSDHAGFFKATGSIDIVSHADRLRQSACFIATRPTDQPLECATCHNPHVSSNDRNAQNQPCLTCHSSATLANRLPSSASRADHISTANCVGCHMPQVKERAVPHGTFTDHWIRVITAAPAQVQTRRRDDRPIEPYFERDRIGPDAEIYQGMGLVIYATQAADARLLSEGAEILTRTLAADTTRGDALFLLGLANRQLGRTDDAIRALERSVRVDPDRPQRLHALAQAYESASRDPASIVRLYARALELQPALAWIRADYADFLQARGRREEAEEAYRAALSERPSLDVAAFNLGTLLVERGQLAESSEMFQRAVALNPLLADALQTLLQVRTVGDVVTGVRILGSPLTTPLVRDRGRGAVQLTVTTGASERGALFVNMPQGASVRILEPDGTLVRALTAEDGPTLTWDLRTEAGSAIAGGLYHVLVRGPATDGRQAMPRRFSFGVVRMRR